MLSTDAINRVSTNNNFRPHIFIEGENLEVLRTMQRAYFGKVKMIYIDPPYNTGSDSFVYPDDYSERQDEYKKRTGITDSEGYLNKQDLWKQNRKENGQFHSVWLSMMYPRLYLARNLLREDGVIFISIDDNEAANLKLLCDEVFGAENFVGQWNWFKSATPPNLSKKIKKNIEFILCYQRGFNHEKFKGITKESPSDDPITKPQNSLKILNFSHGTLNISGENRKIPIGIYGTEKYPNELLNELIVENGTNSNHVSFRNRFVWTQEKLDTELSNGTRVSLSKNLVLSYKKADYGEEVPPNLIDEKVGVETTENAGKDLTDFFNGIEVFDYPKPVSLLKYLINFCCTSSDLILDFFAGSGTTAQAVLELNEEDGGNRRFICVQMPEPTGEGSEAHKAGYKTIADITRARICKVIEKIEAARQAKAEKAKGELFGANVETRFIASTTPIPTGCMSFKLAASNFKIWDQHVVGEEEILQQLDMFQQAEKEGSLPQNMLYELMLKSGFELTTPVERILVGEDTRFIASLYNVANNRLWVFFDKYSAAVKQRILEAKPERLLFLDSCFGGDGAAISNFRSELREHGIDLTII